MTREEKAHVADEVLSRYERLGATVVSDDSTLCRLLKSLESRVPTGTSATTSAPSSPPEGRCSGAAPGGTCDCYGKTSKLVST